MKKFLFWVSLLLSISLVACNLPAQTTGPQIPDAVTPPTLSADEMQTQISQMLTVMPTNTVLPQGGEVTATQALPTVVVETATPGEAALPLATATLAPEAVATQAAPQATATTGPTATTAPSATATRPAGPTATLVPGDPRGRLGSPTSTDNMDNANTWTWPTGSDKYTRGTFGSGVQSITALTGTDGWRMANPVGRSFSNLYLEATFRLGACSGSDHYGLIARVPVLEEPDQGYLFGFTCDGRYSLRRWNGEVGVKGEMKWLVNWTASTAILSGANQVNRIGLMASGGRLILYANGQLLKEVQDSSYPSGYFGVFVGSDNTKDLTVQLDEMSYWENAQP
jgi:hypothetical protein